MKRHVLKGSEYVEDETTPLPHGGFDRHGKYLYDDLPDELKVTEAVIEANPWVAQYVTYKGYGVWYGCPVAVNPMAGGELFWFRCPWKPLENGYCYKHRRRAPGGGG